MTQPVRRPVPSAVPPAAAGMTPAETARYTCELLDSLRKIAARQNQGMLAHLLELARYEAHSLTIKPTRPDSPDAGRNVLPVPVPAEQ